jgi:hypothetical protein
MKPRRQARSGILEESLAKPLIIGAPEPVSLRLRKIIKRSARPSWFARQALGVRPLPRCLRGQPGVRVPRLCTGGPRSGFKSSA